MPIELAAGSSATYKAQYFDASHNPTGAPANAPPLTWALSDPSVATIEPGAITGNPIALTATGAVGATATLTVTDGTFTSEPDTVTIVAGAAAGLEILPAG